MPRTIIANIPARKQYKARIASYAQDDAGNWVDLARGYKVQELDVIDVCKSATNWDEIRREHFPMFGFSR